MVDLRTIAGVAAIPGVESQRTRVEDEPMSETTIVCPACQNRQQGMVLGAEGQEMRCPRCGMRFAVGVPSGSRAIVVSSLIPRLCLILGVSAPLLAGILVIGRLVVPHRGPGANPERSPTRIGPGRPEIATIVPGRSLEA